MSRALFDKKPVIICLCILAIFFVYRSLFAEQSITVEVLVKASEQTDFQLFYTEGKEDFSEEKSIHIVSQYPGRSEMLSFKLPVKKIHGLRLDFGTGAQKKALELNSVRVNGKKLDLTAAFSKGIINQIDDVASFEQGYRLRILQQDPFLIFPSEMVDFTAVWHISWLRFLTTAVLLYILLNFVMERVFIPYWKQENDRLELCFLAGLCIFFILPAGKLNFFAVVDSNEQRPLAKYPSVWMGDSFNIEFGKGFEAWFNDRFGGRGMLLKIHDTAERLISRGQYENDKAFEGLDHWLFYKGEKSMELYQNRLLFTEDQKETIKKNLESQQRWLTSHGIKYFVFVAPNKEDVYGEFYKPGVFKAAPQDRISLLSAYLQDENSSIQINYPLAELIQHKPEALLYWKTDTHWSEYGAYIGYSLMMEEIKKQCPDAAQLLPDKMQYEEKSAGMGDLSKMLSVKDLFPYTATYRIPEPETGQNYQVVKEETKNNMPFYIQTQKPQGKYKVIIFRDSFSTNMIPYLSESFGEVIYIWDHNINNYANLILQEKPDLVILETVSRTAGVLLQAAPNWKEGDK